MVGYKILLLEPLFLNIFYVLYLIPLSEHLEGICCLFLKAWNIGRNFLKLEVCNSYTQQGNQEKKSLELLY